MTELIIGLIFLAGIYQIVMWVIRGTRKAKHRIGGNLGELLDESSHEPWRNRQYDPTILDDGPSGDRFANWDEAFNRAISDDLTFAIEYADREGVVTEREISPTSIHLIRFEPVIYIKAYCHMRKETRTFRSDRIMECRNLKTGRKIADLGQYLRGKY